ncbi:hypothetical protein Pyrfu_1199 [Pyrolobus fumarii 1A]|uniref:Uncharacterized protein n=1 Tax=Pyrolobus fumarii (strain DSM 11204 / 1A) TaxID=694429 RepID=G0EFW0_PYRF1|nr:type II toxin-antitoxin system VapC family toxin [Pyrolobus fumarii]AEM39061.1 hypothetical protein Pyrfu_1199 [Pyrolobus fumarii 1A]
MGCSGERGEEGLSKLLFDASALYPLAKLLVKKPYITEKLLDRLAILDLTLYEACNAALIEHRRRLAQDPHRVCKFVANLAELIEVIRVQPAWLNGIMEVALKKRLTFYDAAYVYTATLYNYTLVTEDSDILRAHPNSIRASQLKLEETL